MTGKKPSLLKSPVFWLALLMLWGAGLRSIQYFNNSSLWFDELTSAKNIQSMSIFSLMTEPLAYNQVAPLGFLLGQKTLTSIFGAGDLTFRFLPWLLSLLAIVFFALLVRQFLTGVKSFAAMALFAAGIALIQQAGNAKQYSGDVAAVIFLCWALLTIIANDALKPPRWLIAFAGGLSALISFPAAIIAVALVAILLWQHRGDIGAFIKSSSAMITVFWTTGAVLNLLYAQFVVRAETRAAMQGWWADGFPAGESFLSTLLWIPEALNNALGHLLFFIPPPMPLAIVPITLIILAVFGLVYLFQKDRLAASVLLSPIVISVLLALSEVLPLRQRVALYAVWPLLIFGFLGLTALQEWLGKVFRPIFTNSFALILALPLLLIASTLGSPPYRSQPAEPVLKSLKAQMRPDDVLYVYCKSRFALEFYGPRLGLENWKQGNCYSSAAEFAADVNDLQGNTRVWFFYTQWTPAEPYPDSLRAYFEKNGSQIGHIPDPFNGSGLREATAYLYDLSIINAATSEVDSLESLE